MFRAVLRFPVRKAQERAGPHPCRFRPARWGNGSRLGELLLAQSQARRGASVSELTEAEARDKATANCERQGGGRCKVVFVYQNQCVSAVTSELASTGTKYVTGASEEIATKLAIQVNRPRFRRHLAAINYGLGGGDYEHEAVHR